jgi:hypothetical protein
MRKQQLKTILIRGVFFGFIWSFASFIPIIKQQWFQAPVGYFLQFLYKWVLFLPLTIANHTTPLKILLPAVEVPVIQQVSWTDFGFINTVNNMAFIGFIQLNLLLGFVLVVIISSILLGIIISFIITMVLNVVSKYRHSS